MEIQREIIVYHSNEKKEISILPTDTDIIILSKIKNVVNPKKPNFVFFPPTFSMEKFRNNKKYELVVLDLEIVPVIELDLENNPRKSIIFHKDVMTGFLETYKLDMDTILKFLLFRIALTIPYFCKELDNSKVTIKKNPKLTEQERRAAFIKKREERIAYNNRIRQENERNRKFANERFLVPYNVVLTEEKRNSFLRAGYQYNKLILDFVRDTKDIFSLIRQLQIQNVFEQKYEETLKMISENERNIQNSKDANEYFLNIPVKESSETQFHGRIFDIHIKTKQYTTGILFDNLQLNEYIPVAHYKSFFKLHKNYSTNILSRENNNLYIYRKEDNGENVQIYCENTHDGLLIQVLLLSNSFIDTLESVYAFLHIDEDLIESKRTKQKGILGEFEFLNCSFYSSIISNMILNGEYRVNNSYNVPYFSSFISVNDSDKISKDSNNIYIYYKKIEKNELPKNSINVGGWNKETSRFGDLTATLTPYKKNDSFFINVRVHRVYHESILDEFKFVMGKLLTLYENFEYSTISLFDTYFRNQEYYQNQPQEDYDIIVPSVINLLKPISELKTSTKVGSLGYENKMLFPGEYVRVCQPPERQPTLFKNENEIHTLNLTNEEKDKRVLVYPRIEKTFKNSILKPNHYYCKTDTYPYVGYVTIKKLNEEHPYTGYTPCCFKRPQFDKNEKIEKFLYKSETIEKDTKITGYKIKKSKIIEQTGQIGELPPIIKSFFTSIDPRINFVRVGIKNEYATSSVLYCCDFATQYEKDVNIELTKDLRQKIMEEKNGSKPIHLISQENVLYGVDFIRTILENERNFINIRHVFRLVQEYFTANLIIFNVNGEIVRPNSMFNYKALYYENEQFILLLEHDNPKRYELIGVEKDETLEFCSFNKHLHFYHQLEFIYRQSLQIKENNNIFPILSSKDYELWKLKLKDTKISSQILNKTGQCYVIHLKYQNNTIVPIVLKNTLPPFDVDQKYKITVPSYHTVQTFLENVFPTKKIEIIKLNSKYSYFLINNEFCFPFLSEESVNYTKEETFHPFLFLTDIHQKSLKKFDNFLNSYTLINVMKDYILVLFGKYLEENSISFEENHEKVILDFKKNYLEFIPGKEYKVETLSCLKNDNLWMFKGEKLKLPKDLDKIMDYFLHWNYKCNENYLKKWKDTNELNFFYFTNQFLSKIENNIQLEGKGQENINYHPYYDFDLEENHEYIFEEKKLYYHYNVRTSEIKPFFIFYGKELSRDNHYYLFSIMEWYYTKKQFTFHPPDLVEETNFMDNFEVFSYPLYGKDEYVTKKTRKKKKDSSSNDHSNSNSEEMVLKKVSKKKFYFTMILFDFI